MSFTSVMNTLVGSLKLVTSRVTLQEGVKLRETKITVLPDPRFTKDQLENLRARAGSTNRQDR